MKKALCILLIISVLVCACACAKTTAPKLSNNIARVYTPATRRSTFFLNGAPIEGEVVGKAYFTSAADGKTSLAWVDTVVYFVSEQGVDQLGTGISTAEISFNGQYAFYFMEDKLYRYSLATRSSEVLDEGLSAVIQLAVSPSGESVMFTASYTGDDKQYRSKLLKDGNLSAVFDDITAVVLAVSDDAQTVYYYDTGAGFCVEKAGERRYISTETGASTNYNFTKDLNEVIFSTNEDQSGVKRQIYYRLSDGRTTELGKNFGYTLKTDVYGISDVNMFCYINDLDTFENGLFMFRETTDEGYLYSIGLIDSKGGMNMLVESTPKYELASDGSCIYWSGVNGLMKTDLKGRTERISDTVVDFVAEADGNGVYYISGSNTLFWYHGTKTPFTVAPNVSAVVSTAKSTCTYITGSEVHYQVGTGSDNGVSIQEGAARFDKRAGQLLLYTDEVDVDGKTTFTLYISVDGKTFARIADGIEP